MDFLIRFCQSYETFRLREVEALATLHGIDLHVKEYRSDVCIQSCLIQYAGSETLTG